jgi:hypothetical protein
MEIPTHTTVLNWTKKQGISQFKNREYYQHQKWVLIADESIQLESEEYTLNPQLTFQISSKAL